MSKKSQVSEVEVQDHVADHYVEKRYKGLGLKYHTRIIEEMMEGIDGKILDAGCGVGLLNDLYPERDIMGIDISLGMLRHHKGKHQYASADNIPFDDNSFDSVVCRSVLHHLHRPEKALQEMKRVLKPGGRFVCWETHKSFVATLVRRLTQHGDSFSNAHTSFNNLPTTVSNFFDVEEIKYQGFIAYPWWGFPDIINFSKITPFRDFFFKESMKIDEIISKIPLIRRISWAIQIKAKKR